MRRLKLREVNLFVHGNPVGCGNSASRQSCHLLVQGLLGMAGGLDIAFRLLWGLDYLFLPETI
jgi:hypothetical protein